MNTQEKIIRLAKENPRLREKLVPLIKAAKEAAGKEAKGDKVKVLNENGREVWVSRETLRGPKGKNYKPLDKSKDKDKGDSEKPKGKGDSGDIGCDSASPAACVEQLLDIEDLKGEFGDQTKPSEADIKAFENHPAIKGLKKDANLEILAGDGPNVSKGDLKRAMHVGAVLQSGIDKSTDFCKVNPPACKGNLGITRNHMPQIMDKPIQKLLDSKDPKDRKKGQAALDAGAKATDTPKDLWIQSLRDDGIEVGMDEIEVGRLIASQSEIKAKKSYDMAKSYLTAVKPDYSIMPKAEVKELDKKCEAAGVDLQEVTEKDIENVIKDAGKREKYLKARGSGFHALPDLPILVARDPDSGDITVIDGHHRYAGLLLADPEKKMKVQVIETGIRDALQRSFDVPGVFRADLDDNVVDASSPLDLARKNGDTWQQKNGKHYAKNSKGELGGPFESEDSAKSFASGKSEGGKKASLAKTSAWAGEFTYQVVTDGNKVQRYSEKDFMRKFRSKIVGYTPEGGRLREELWEQPKVRGLHGPMWNGIQGGKAEIRYEDLATNKRMSLASSKVAHRPYLQSKGLDARKVNKGEGFMLYMIDQAKNHSKFYEGVMLDNGDGTYQVFLRWGALTDSGFTGRIDGEKFDARMSALSEREAKAVLMKKYRDKTRKGYVDAFKHKLSKGQYPVGLKRDVGFGWGTQESAFCTPALRAIQDLLRKAQSSLSRMDLSGAAALQDEAAQMAKSDRSTMLKKVNDNIQHMQGRAESILAMPDPSGRDVRIWNTAMSRLISYLDKQLSVCHTASQSTLTANDKLRYTRLAASFPKGSAQRMAALQVLLGE